MIFFYQLSERDTGKPRVIGLFIFNYHEHELFLIQKAKEHETMQCDFLVVKTSP